MKKSDLIIAFPYVDIPDLTGEDIAVYSYLYALAYNRNIPDGVLHLHTSTLMWHINDKLNIISAQTIKKSLEKFFMYGINKISEFHYTVNLRDFFQSKQEYTSLHFEDIHKIVQSAYKCRWKMLLYYHTLIKSVDKNVEYAGEKYFMTACPETYLAEIVKAGVSAIQTYNDYLVDLGIIYVYHTASMKHTNLIGLMKNKDLIVEYAMAHNIAELTGMFYNVAVNKYNAFCNGKFYSDEEIEEIKIGIRHYNKNHPGKEKDLSVFS